MKNNKICLVTGMHRSGTTIFGEIIKRIANAYMIYEPLNKNIGIKGIDYWYQYLDRDCPNHIDIINNLLEVDLEFKRVHEQTDSLFRSITGMTIGYLDYIKFKYIGKMQSKKVVYKDPFMLFNASLFSSYTGCKVFVIVRHPVAIYNSLIRKNWDFDLNELYNQQPLKEKFLDKINIDRSCKCQKIAFLWKQLYKLTMLNKSNNKIFVITHEELSVNPFNVIDRISSFLEMPINIRVERFVKKNFFSTNIESRNNQIHDYKRNSRKLAWEWRKENKEEYRVIEEICKEELKFFYPEIYK